MVRTGAMRYIISVQQRSQTLDAWGAPTEAWVEVFSCRAAIDWTPGREVFEAAARNARTPTTFRIRWRAGVVPSMRIVYQTRVFNIISAVDQDGRREQLTLMAEELVSEVAGEPVAGLPYVPAALYIRADHTTLAPVAGLAAIDVQGAVEELAARKGATAPLVLVGAAAAQPVLVVLAAPGQTANILEISDSAAAVRFRVASDGALYAPAYNFQLNGAGLTAGKFKGPGVLTTVIGSAVPNGATAVGTIIDTDAALATAGAKLVSIRNGGVEKAYFDKDGNIILLGGAQLRANVNTNQMWSQSLSGNGQTLTVSGNPADGATAVGVIINSGPLANVGAKIASIRNNGVEKAFFDKDGGLTVLGVASGGNAFVIPAGAGLVFNTATQGAKRITRDDFTYYFDGNAQLASTLYTGAGLISTQSARAIEIRGQAADSAAAIGVRLNTAPPYVAAGAKIATFENDDVVKAFVDKDGNVEVTGNAGAVILRSPNGTRFSITVSDAGALTTTAL